MNEAAIASQVAAIMGAVAGIQASCDIDQTPPQINLTDLPLAVTLIGPGSDQLRMAQTHLSRDELLTITSRVYVLPTAQGENIGKSVDAVATLLPLAKAAFDARPKLVNYDGESENADDFDFAAADLKGARLSGHTGVVVRAYGKIDYFATEFTIECIGYREVSSKVEGN